MMANMPPTRWAVYHRDDGKYTSRAMGSMNADMIAMPPLMIQNIVQR